MNDRSLPPPLTPDINPYAPPATPLSQQPFGDALTGVVRDGKQLVVKRGHESQVPTSSCVKCGAASVKTVKKGYYWHHPLVFALLLVSPVIYIIAAFIVRKTMRIECGLCDRHAQRRTRLILGGWGCFVTSIVLAVAAASELSSPGLLWAGFGVLLLTGLILVVAVSRAVLLPKKITSEFGCLSGAGEEYLAQLPEVYGAAKF